MKYFLNFKLFDSFGWFSFFKKISILTFFLVIYIPWLTVLILSFSEVQDEEKGIVSTNLQNLFSQGNWTFKNFENFFSFKPGNNDYFWKSFINSLAIAISSVCPAIWLSIISSYAIWKKGGKLKFWVFKISNLSISSPEIIQGLSFMLLFSAIILPLGFNFGFLTIVLSHIAFLVPYGIIIIYPKLEKINRKLFLASLDLNCGEIETLFRVIIPQLKGVIKLSFLVLILLSMDDFIITNLVKGRVITITTQLYTMKKGVKAWALTFGALILLSSIIFYIVYSQIKFIRRKRKGSIPLLLDLT